jgi:outer membrane protein assembly factor BamD (BamD/ComL family)
MGTRKMTTSTQTLLFMALLASTALGCRSETYVQNPDDIQSRRRYVDKRYSGERDPINLPSKERKHRRSISEALLDQGRGSSKESSVILKQAFDESVDAKTAEQAIYLSAEAAFKGRLLRTAYRNYLVLIDTFPQSEYYAAVVLRIFELGKLAIEEGTNDGPSFFLIGDNDTEFGVKVLRFFVNDYDQHPNADDALFIIGTQQRADGLQEQAIATWKRLRTEYPTTAFARLAAFRIAQAQIELTEDVERDKKPLIAARDGLRDYTRTYLTGDDVQQAASTLRDLENVLAGHNMTTALAYRRDDRWGGFEIYLKHILTEYPKSDVAPEAKALLADFEARREFYTSRQSWRKRLRQFFGED